MIHIYFRFQTINIEPAVILNFQIADRWVNSLTGRSPRDIFFCCAFSVFSKCDSSNMFITFFFRYSEKYVEGQFWWFQSMSKNLFAGKKYKIGNLMTNVDNFQLKSEKQVWLW